MSGEGVSWTRLRAAALQRPHARTKRQAQVRRTWAKDQPTIPVTVFLTHPEASSILNERFTVSQEKQGTISFLPLLHYH